MICLHLFFVSIFALVFFNLHIYPMRIILFTGKGGTGKTTAAAATAIQAAKMGHKTLVISTDPAHSLADALDQTLGPEPTEVAPNLWGQELDVYYSMKKYWDNMRSLMRSLFRWQGVKNIVAEELSVLPGMEEASAFLWIEKYYTEKKYDLIVIDSAPTGETLTLLTLPQVTRSWLTKAFPGQSLAIKTFGSLLRNTTGIPLDKGYAELETLFDKLERVQQVMLDPEVCTVRIVANPERMVIQEAKRAYTYLQLYGYSVDAIIVNRLIPEPKEKKSTSTDSFFEQYLVSQKKYLQEIEESFQPLPILKVGHLGREVFGKELLSQIGHSLYGEGDPAQIYFSDSPFRIKEDKKHYEIQLRLPFIEEDDFTLAKHGDELIIDLGSRRKSVILPRFANFLELDEYEFRKPWLLVRLSKS